MLPTTTINKDNFSFTHYLLKNWRFYSITRIQQRKNQIPQRGFPLLDEIGVLLSDEIYMTLTLTHFEISLTLRLKNNLYKFWEPQVNWFRKSMEISNHEISNIRLTQAWHIIQNMQPNAMITIVRNYSSAYFHFP